jgi:hypothetical protein
LAPLFISLLCLSLLFPSICSDETFGGGSFVAGDLSDLAKAAAKHEQFLLQSNLHPQHDEQMEGSDDLQSTFRSQLLSQFTYPSNFDSSFLGGPSEQKEGHEDEIEANLNKMLKDLDDDSSSSSEPSSKASPNIWSTPSKLCMYRY